MNFFKNETSFRLINQHWIDFLWELTLKEIKTRYRFAVLGFFWIFLNPLLQMIAIGIIFRFFIEVKVENYFFYLFVGLLPWNFFSLSLGKTVTTIVNERPLIQKANFPRESLVLSQILANFFYTVISLMIVSLIAPFVLNQGLGPLLWLVNIFLKFFSSCIVLLVFCIFISGLSLFLSALNVRYRDVNFIIQAVLPIWFYVTPIVYTITAVPTWIQLFLYANPVLCYVEFFKWIFLEIPIASPFLLFLNFCLSLFIAMFGLIYFRLNVKYFDDWL